MSKPKRIRATYKAWYAANRERINARRRELAKDPVRRAKNRELCKINQTYGPDRTEYQKEYYRRKKEEREIAENFEFAMSSEYWGSSI